MSSSETCPRCTGPREAKALYCPFCGAVFEEMDQRTGTGPAATAAPPPPAAPAAEAPAGSPAEPGEPAAGPGGLPDVWPEEGLNPYQAPAARVELPRRSSSRVLASRTSRLLAQFANGLILYLPVVPFLIFFSHVEDMAELGDQPLFLAWLSFTFIWVLAVFVLNLVHLHRSGQSLGKKLLKIRIVSDTGETVSLARLVFLRFLPIQLMTAIPLVGPFIALVDLLMIFGVEQRCLHDHIAGTKVVEAEPAAA